MTCRLSIIIPTLNEGIRISSCLRSLQHLRKAGHEIIIVDGGSGDDTLAQADGLADHCLQSTAGRARQMNHGAAVAKGDFLLFLHADTLLPQSADKAIINALDNNSKYAWGRFNVRLSGDHRALRLIATMMNLRSRLSGIATGDQGIFVERRTFTLVDGFPDIALMEDIALSRRLKRISRPACLHLSVVTSSRRWENNGILKTILLMWHLRLAYFFGAKPAQLAKRYDHHD